MILRTWEIGILKEQESICCKGSLVHKSDKDILVNDVDYMEYFKIADYQLIILDS